MSTDAQATVTTQLGQTLAQLDKIAQRMTNIEKATVMANRASRDYQRTTAKGMGVGDSAASVGRSLSRAGGGAVGRVLGGAGMDGAFGRIAVGLGVAGFALNAFRSVVERNVEQVKRSNDAMEAHTRAVEAGKKVIESQVKAGLATAGTRRGLLISGGGGALKEATDLQTGSMGAVSAEEAGQAVIAVNRKFPRANRPQNFFRKKNALAGIRRLTRLGMSASEASELVLKGNAELETEDSTDKFIQRGYDKRFGRGAYVSAQYNAADTANDRLMIASQLSSEQTMKQEAMNVNAAIKDNGAQAQLETARLANPVMTAIGDLQKARDLQIAAMQRVAESEGVMGAALANFALAFGGAGSQQFQLDQQNRANGATE